MSLPAAIADGGVSIQPWQIPKLGGGGMGSSNQRGIGESRGAMSTGPTSQGLGSTGVGGGFVQPAWPGRMAPAIHRGFFGGEGIRTGGAG